MVRLLLAEIPVHHLRKFNLLQAERAPVLRQVARAHRQVVHHPRLVVPHPQVAPVPRLAVLLHLRVAPLLRADQVHLRVVRRLQVVPHTRGAPAHPLLPAVLDRVRRPALFRPGLPRAPKMIVIAHRVTALVASDHRLKPRSIHSSLMEAEQIHGADVPIILSQEFRSAG